MNLATLPPPNLDALSTNQRNILRCLARGMGTDDMSRELSYAPQTIKSYLTPIFHAIGVETRTQAAVVAWHAGLGDEEIER